ncbi:MAG: exosortase/archaeosortase family protein [Tepidisphaeraceae bacterium]
MQTSIANPSPLPIPGDTAPQPTLLGVSYLGWGKTLLIAAAFAWLYRFNLVRLWEKTNFINGDPNWSHSMCIPLIGLYYLFLRRDELRATPVEPLLIGRWTRARWVSAALVILAGGLLAASSLVVPQREGLWLLKSIVLPAGYAVMVLGTLALLLDWGLATLFGGLLLSAYGIFPGRNDFAWDTGMIVTLFGIVLTLGGWKIMRLAWFPIVFLLCALPWPGLVYSQIASPMQSLAAKVSVFVLQTLGMDASYGGTKIFIPQFDAHGTRIFPDRALNVAEACAGLRSLMTFISVAAAVAFLSARPLWQKLVITFSAIPIAISCNVLRVAGQGLIDHYIGREWSEGFAHQFAGMVMLLPAFFLIMLVCWIVDQIFLDEADAPPAPPPGATPAGGAA